MHLFGRGPKAAAAKARRALPKGPVGTGIKAAQPDVDALTEALAVTGNTLSEDTQTPADRAANLRYAIQDFQRDFPGQLARDGIALPGGSTVTKLDRQLALMETGDREAQADGILLAAETGPFKETVQTGDDTFTERDNPGTVDAIASDETGGGDGSDTSNGGSDEDVLGGSDQTIPMGLPRDSEDDEDGENDFLNVVGEAIGDEWEELTSDADQVAPVDSLRDHDPSFPDNPQQSNYVTFVTELTPNTSVIANSDIYGHADTALNNAPDAIRSNWFALARDTTDWNGVGALDAGTGIGEQEADYLDFVHHGLVPYNLDKAKLLVKGEYPPGLEGLTGLELDKALVRQEQGKVDELTEQYLEQNPNIDREELMQKVSDVTTGESLDARYKNEIWDTRNDRLEQSLETLFPGGNYDAGNIEHRVNLGNHMLEKLAKEREDGASE